MTIPNPNPINNRWYNTHIASPNENDVSVMNLMVLDIISRVIVFIMAQLAIPKLNPNSVFAMKDISNVLDKSNRLIIALIISFLLLILDKLQIISG